VGLLQTIKTWFLGLRKQGLPLRARRFGELNYRLANKDDIESLLEIERDVFEEIPWTYSHFQHEISDNPRATFIVAESSEQILGYIGLRWNLPHTEFHISNFVVRKSQQNTGIGSQLLIIAEELASNLKISHLTLEVSRPDFKAQGFYRKRGFESARVLAAYYNDGRDALEMEKELTLEP
jgi:ribosomal-protein-alanine N-acetyltransferase